MRDHSPNPTESCDMPLVETLGVTKDEEGNLVLIIDGVLTRLPGASASASLNEDGKIVAYVYAQFHATTVDMTAGVEGS